MLIYATDKGPEQLEGVNRLLQEMGLRAHQLTAEETLDGRLVGRVLEAFRDGAIQVLTAKRVLDEGLNVPEIAEALILASTTVERQWVQRRGRILRPCNATGKDHAVLHDFLVLPPEARHGVDEDTRKLIQGEVNRIREFGRLARNAAAEGGPRATLQPIILEYFG
jgi:superfamily II DNA or RNA helicase